MDYFSRGVLFVVAQILSLVYAAPERRFACWGSFGPPVVSAQCPRDTVIQVVRAGLKVQGHGGGCAFSSADCGCEYGEEGCNMPDVRDLCMGRPACRLDVTQQYINTQGCRGFSDYMFIDFSCVKVNLNSMHDICTSSASTHQEGYILSPHYPRPYPEDRHCQCTLTAASQDDAIQLKVLDFQMDDPTCKKSNFVYQDTLLIEDNTKKTRLCGHSVGDEDTFTSDGGRMLLTFLTDSYKGNGGFWLKYEGSSEVEVTCTSYFKEPGYEDYASISEEKQDKVLKKKKESVEVVKAKAQSEAQPLEMTSQSPTTTQGLDMDRTTEEITFKNVDIATLDKTSVLKDHGALKKIRPKSNSIAVEEKQIEETEYQKGEGKTMKKEKVPVNIKPEITATTPAMVRRPMRKRPRIRRPIQEARESEAGSPVTNRVRNVTNPILPPRETSRGRLPSRKVDANGRRRMINRRRRPKVLIDKATEPKPVQETEEYAQSENKQSESPDSEISTNSIEVVPESDDDRTQQVLAAKKDLVPLKIVTEEEEKAVYDEVLQSSAGLGGLKDLAKVLNLDPEELEASESSESAGEGEDTTSNPWWWKFTVPTQNPLNYYVEDYMEESLIDNIDTAAEELVKGNAKNGNVDAEIVETLELEIARSNVDDVLHGSDPDDMLHHPLLEQPPPKHHPHQPTLNEANHKSTPLEHGENSLPDRKGKSALLNSNASKTNELSLSKSNVERMQPTSNENDNNSKQEMHGSRGTNQRNTTGISVSIRLNKQRGYWGNGSSGKRPKHAGREGKALGRGSKGQNKAESHIVKGLKYPVLYKGSKTRPKVNIEKTLVRKLADDKVGDSKTRFSPKALEMMRKYMYKRMRERKRGPSRPILMSSGESRERVAEGTTMSSRNRQPGDRTGQKATDKYRQTSSGTKTSYRNKLGRNYVQIEDSRYRLNSKMSNDFDDEHEVNVDVSDQQVTGGYTPADPKLITSDNILHSIVGDRNFQYLKLPLSLRRKIEMWRQTLERTTSRDMQDTTNRPRMPSEYNSGKSLEEETANYPKGGRNNERYFSKRRNSYSKPYQSVEEIESDMEVISTTPQYRIRGRLNNNLPKDESDDNHNTVVGDTGTNTIHKQKTYKGHKNDINSGPIDNAAETIDKPRTGGEIKDFVFPLDQNTEEQLKNHDTKDKTGSFTGRSAYNIIPGGESITVTIIAAGVIGSILLIIIIGIVVRFVINRSDPRHLLRQRHKKECAMRRHRGNAGGCNVTRTKSGRGSFA